MKTILLILVSLVTSIAFADGWRMEALEAIKNDGLEAAQEVVKKASEYDDSALFFHARDLAVDGKHDEALQVYKELLDKGYQEPLLEMAMIYIYVKGDPVSTQVGTNLMHIATQFSVEAQVEMASMYELGTGVRKNLLLSCSWYKTAKKNGLRGLEDSIKRVCD